MQTFSLVFFYFRDGNRPPGDSWVKMYRMASSFVQRDKGIFSPCFTYDNPNEYKVGKSNATVRIYFSILFWYFRFYFNFWIISQTNHKVSWKMRILKIVREFRQSERPFLAYRIPIFLQWLFFLDSCTSELSPRMHFSYQTMDFLWRFADQNWSWGIFSFLSNF